MKITLSTKQQEHLEFYKLYFIQNHSLPPISAIAERFDISLNGAQTMRSNLAKKGFIIKAGWNYKFNFPVKIEV